MFGTRASFLVDLFLLVLVLLLPAILIAVELVRRGKLNAHRRLMTACFVLFLLAVAAFEIDVHFGESTEPLAKLPLAIHLCLAIPCLLVWVFQMWTAKLALVDPAPHRRRGRMLIVLLFATVGTGIWLYVATFGSPS